MGELLSALPFSDDDPLHPARAEIDVDEQQGRVVLPTLRAVLVQQNVADGGGLVDDVA